MGRLIDADVLKRKMQRLATQAWKMKIKASVETVLNQFIDDIDHAPTVDAVPVRHGYWIRHENADIVDGYLVPNFECSECHSWKEDDSDYCPDCGTRMDGKDGDGNC